MSAPLSLPTLPARFARIIADLCHEVPKHIARDRHAGPLIILIYSYLRRLGARFAAIAARAQAGTLRAIPRRATRKPVARRLTWPRPPRALPTGYLWLGRLV